MQNRWKKGITLLLFGLLITGGGHAMADDGASTAGQPFPPAINADQQCGKILEILEEQNAKTGREFRQLKREVAALGQKMETPGISEILGGIGYIIGIFGVAAYVMSRKKDVSGGR